MFTYTSKCATYSMEYKWFLVLYTTSFLYYTCTEVFKHCVHIDSFILQAYTIALLFHLLYQPTMGNKGFQCLD